MTAMAATGSDSFSSGSVLSDTDLETIQSEELVIFHSIQTAYSNKKDITAIYSSGNSVENKSKDWIGLFKSSWQTIYDFSAYQWAPLEPFHPSQPRKRKTIFPQADIADLTGRFQFLYVTRCGEVMGVSDCFDVCTVEPTLEPLLNNENIPTSLSLISLGSQSSSDDSTSWEITSERSTDAAEEILSIPSSSSSQVSALVPCIDYWTLSDFVVGNNSRDFSERLCFARSYDWKSLLEEYEPLKKIFLSPEGKCFIETIHSNKGGQASSVSGQVGTSNLVVVDKAASGLSSLLPSGPFLFTLRREGFLSQQSSLRLFQPKTLKSTVEEQANKIGLHAAGSSDKDASKAQSYPQWTLVDCKDSQPGSSGIQRMQWSLTVHSALQNKSLKEHSNEFKTNVFEFAKRKAEEHHRDFNQSVKGVACVDTDPASSSTSMEHSTSTAERNFRKKRWVQQSKNKTTRRNQDIALQEALTFIKRAPFPSTSSLASTSRVEPEDDASPGSTPAEDSADFGRKRRHHNAATLSKPKRRRLTRRAATPRPSISAGVEDEGYCSLAEDDASMIPSYCPAECIELLSMALNESLKDNAELRRRLRQVESKMSTVTRNTSSTKPAVSEEKECGRPAESHKARNLETPKTSEAATSTAAKKDIPVQCASSTKKKGTNTEKKSERHVASNTSAVAKTDTPCQCVATTSAKSVNTISRCVNTSAKSVNTLPISATKETQSSAVYSSEPQSTIRAGSAVEARSEIVTLDLTVHCAPHLSPASSGPDASLGEWKRVSSKRVIRLQKLIMKKRQEFARLRENAENYEKRTRMLEASLQSVRTSLSVETIKRMNAEKELRELRIRFWELLGSRKSQPWRTAKKSDGSILFNENSRRPKLGTSSEPDLVESVKATSTASISEEQIAHLQPRDIAEHTEISMHECKEDSKMPGPKEDNSSCEGKRETNLPKKHQESDKEQLTKIISSKKASSSEHTEKSEPKKKDHPEESKPKRSEVKEDRKCMNHSEHKPKSVETIPVTATAKFNGVPVPVTEVKRTTCGAISFKKFLMPAMAALAETFSSSKCKTKTPSKDEPIPSTTSATDKTQNKSFASGLFTSVSVSFSTDSPTEKSSSKHQSVSKSRSAKRSRSRGKDRSKAEVTAKTSCQETVPESSSDITLRKRLSDSSPDTQKFEIPEILSIPIILPIPAARSRKTKDGGASAHLSHYQRPKAGGSFPLAQNVKKLRSLYIPEKAWADDEDEYNDVSSDSIVPAVQPFKTSPTIRHPAGKGRPLSYVDDTTGNSSRNHLARAMLSRDPEPQTIHDVMGNAAPPGFSNVMSTPACNTFLWSADKTSAGVKSSSPFLPSPLSCFYRPLPSTSLTTSTFPISRTSTTSTTISSSSSSSTTPSPFMPTLFSPNLPKTTSVIITQPRTTLLSGLPPSGKPAAGHKIEHFLQPNHHVSAHLHRHHHHLCHQQQCQQQLTLLSPPLSPRVAALQLDPMVGNTAATKMPRAGTAAQGPAFQGLKPVERCQACGMKFTPTMNRNWMEEHQRCHNTYTD